MSYKLDDFKMDLKKCLTPPNHIWAVSGYSVSSPKMGTVAAVCGCFSPPFAAPDVFFGVEFNANGHLIADTGNKGKGDCGLLYSGGEWLPGKIVRCGTYHYNFNGKLLSFSVTSELTPLFGAAGFAVKVSVKNRMKDDLDISVSPVFSKGTPFIVPLSEWEFTPPRKSENGNVAAALLQEAPPAIIKEYQTHEFLFAVLFAESGIEIKPCNIAGLIEKTAVRWQNLLKLTSENIPELKSDIPGLENYYNRSLISGLVCLWENDGYITNPFPATGGADGGAICCYPWDVAGYSAQTLVMLLGEKALDFLKAMLDSGIDSHISMALDGGGLGWCSYSYSMWSLVNLYLTILTYCNQGHELFDDIVRIFENEEKRLPEWEHLKDYGRQHNLLEMRSCGYEYFVVSPNAERAQCYDILADIGQTIGRDSRDWAAWHTKADLIRQSIRVNLWDGDLGWFKCLHPEGHVEVVYSIQMFDSMKGGVCDENMKKALLRHIRDGAFLGKYGASSISVEDTLHYELNDPDWSGGGSYSGDGPELAGMLWNENEPGLAWDVLKRHFWMGEHLIYYPQEHYCDIPGVPQNKRANIISGVAGLQAVLFGMAGIKPAPDGSIKIKPDPPEYGFVEISGFKFRNKKIDIFMKPGYIKIILDGNAIYEGEPKAITV